MEKYKVLAEVLVIDEVEFKQGEVVELPLVKAEGLMAEGKIAVDVSDETVGVDLAEEGADQSVESDLVPTLEDAQLGGVDLGAETPLVVAEPLAEVAGDVTGAQQAVA